ncbi:MAG: DNA-processing protein DprA [Neomegalonema sp.]|nr:DNA-processing protein DprA [Neomegalonema sp.]
MSALFEAPALVAPEKVPQSPEEKRAWLRLLRSQNVGPITFLQLINRYPSATDALEALPELAARGGRRSITLASRESVEAEIARAQRVGARMLCLGAPGYPPLLAQIDAPPPVLWSLGTPPAPSSWAAVVGARNASALGLKLAEQLAADLTAQGYCIVSGMARGIDTAAHRGALTGAAGTVAVLAGGVDVIYPPENDALYRQIIERGLVVSEMPMGAEPLARRFLRRNRIIAGMAQGVVVVEAALRSGSLSTARHAAEQGREAMAVPGSPLDPRCAGCNGLIRDGAALIRDAADVIEALSGQRGLLREPSPAFLARPADPAADLDALRTRMRNLLGPSPVAIDELIRQSGAAPEAIAQILLEMELAGTAQREPGGLVRALRSLDH